MNKKGWNSLLFYVCAFMLLLHSYVDYIYLYG